MKQEDANSSGVNLGTRYSSEQESHICVFLEEPTEFELDIAGLLSGDKPCK